jgi:AcrR family transcriptional regulator
MTETARQATHEPPRGRKDEILDVATLLFAERGYEGTSMNDVAERVGMRKASLFYHFATKDALYAAALERLIDDVGQRLGAVYAGDGTFLERVETAADALTTILGERPLAARVLLREAMDWGPVIRGALLERVLLVLEAGSAFVRAGQEAGVFAEGDPKQLVLTALGAHVLPFVIGQVVERYVGVGPFDPRFIDARRAALRTQVRDMLVRRPVPHAP